MSDIISISSSSLQGVSWSCKQQPSGRFARGSRHPQIRQYRVQVRHAGKSTTFANSAGHVPSLPLRRREVKATAGWAALLKEPCCHGRAMSRNDAIYALKSSLEVSLRFAGVCFALLVFLCFSVFVTTSSSPSLSLSLCGSCKHFNGF